MRTLQMTDGTGTFRVQIPDECKVTFGPSLPMDPKNKARYQSSDIDRSYAVRVYNGASEKKGVLAVFPGVWEFRELHVITVLRPMLDNSGNEIWSDDEAAWRKAQEVTERLSPEETSSPRRRSFRP